MQQTSAQLDAYVRGKLTPEEAAGLEVEILENPGLLAEFELTVALREGARELELPTVTKAESGQWWRPWIGRPMATGALLAVAVVALVQLASLSSRGVLDMEVQPPAALSANVPILTFSRLRSARENPEFSTVVDAERLKSSDIAVLELEIDWPPHEEYEVILAAQNSRASGLTPVGDEGAAEFAPRKLRLEPDDRGYLVLAVPTGIMPPGDYIITITPLDNSSKEASERQHYNLRVKSG